MVNMKKIILASVLTLGSANAFAIQDMSAIFGVEMGSQMPPTNIQPFAKTRTGNLYNIAPQDKDKDPRFTNYYIYITPQSSYVNGISAVAQLPNEQACEATKSLVIKDYETKYGASQSLKGSSTGLLIPDAANPARSMQLTCTDKVLMLSVLDVELTKKATEEYNLNPSSANASAPAVTPQ